MRVVIPDRDPYDLEVVYPADPLLAGSARLIDVDVVAVHGLNIEDNLMHHRDTWTQDDVLWLRDILPEFLHQRCRVMLFSWNVGRGVVEHDTYIARHALRLLLALNEKRQHCPNRPLIFICQDVGGFIVKDAILTAGPSQIPSFKATFDATKMFVFFNTPHRDQASVARIIAEAALVSPHEAVVGKLVRECTSFAGRLEPWEVFSRLYNGRSVINLHATNPHRCASLLVGRADTTLGLPDYMEKQYPIYGDHSSICKFDSIHDPACRMVAETIAGDLDGLLDQQI